LELGASLLVPILRRTNFFIISIHWIFTTLVERPFTNAFDVSRENGAIACVVHAGHAD